MQSSTPVETLYCHEDLADALLEAVYEERRCISELNLEQMKPWAERRALLARRAIELGSPISDDIALDYQHVDQMAQENLSMLQDAHQAISGVLSQIVEANPQTYGPQARLQRQSSPRGVLVWRG
jgi:hypothetical protein